MAGWAEEGLKGVAAVSEEAQQVVLDIQRSAHQALLLLFTFLTALQVAGQRSTTVLTRYKEKDT